MKTSLLNEAFKAFGTLNEEDFSLSNKKSIEAMKDFKENDEKEDLVDIIDPEADEEEEIKDVYVGKVILDCCVCHSLIYKNADSIEADEDTTSDDTLVNIGEECPYCFSNDGYKIVGQVAAFKPAPEVKVKVEPKEDGEEAEVTVDVDGDGKADVKIEVEPSDEEKEVEVTEEPKEEEKVESEEVPVEVEAEKSEDEPKEEEVAKTEDEKEVEEVKEDEEASEEKVESEDEKSEEEKEEVEESLNENKETLWDKLVKAYPELAEEDGLTEEVCPECGKDLDKEEPCEECKEEKVEEELCDKCGKDVEEPCEECKEEVKEECLSEGLENVNLETDKEKINISVEDKPAVEGEEMVAPITPAVENEMVSANLEEVPAFAEPKEEASVIDEPVAEEVPEEEVKEEVAEEPVEEIPEESEDEMVDIDLNDFDEESFDKLGEAYLKNIYENVNSFKTSDVAQKENSLIIEGIITFASGKEKKTTFMFEAKDATKTGKVRFIGENLQIAKGHRAFQMSGRVNESKFIAESLNYNYRQKLTEGKSTRVYGTVSNKK